MPRAWLLLNGVVALAQTVEYGRDIRPIVSEHCFQCHGPDAGARQAGLRLDTSEGLLNRPGLVIPGRAGESRLYRRIGHENPAMRMPPPHAKKALQPAQIALVGRWIDEGARWQEHWSFRPPLRPKVPPSKKWVRNPIDAFVLARLEEAGLQPAPEADRRTLIRRLSFDLTGLPPSPAEVEAFVEDRSVDAYEKAVDRLLASPHWGEHRARYWLDAARYADTHGLHADNYREIWPYRDWVIQAFNRNLPFSKFTIDQIAGDLLPSPGTDELVATGFHRCNITTNEGGVIADEAAAMYARDRVETTATVWLGLTIGCAACHDHEFDPIPQKDFYRFAAFFGNTTQKPLDGNIPSTPPVLVIPRPEDRARWLEQSAIADELRRQARSGTESFEARFQAWLKNRDGLQPVTEVPRPLLVAVPAGEPVEPPPGGLEFENGPRFELNQPFSLSGWVRIPEQAESAIASFVGSRGSGARWSLAVRAMFLQFGIDDPRSGRAAQAKAVGVRLPPGGLEHIAVTYDGSGKESGINFYVGGRAVHTGPAHDGYSGWRRAPFERAMLRIGSDGTGSLEGGAVRAIEVHGSELSGIDVRTLAARDLLEGRSGPEKISTADRERLKQVLLAGTDMEHRRILQKLDSVEKELRGIRRRAVTTLVMEEAAGSPATARVLARGQYDQPGETVQAGVPEVLGPLAPEAPRNRLGLAQWLVSAGNPLVARTALNRFWQDVFGSGLVKTSEDFGVTGEPPSHPELLDWLAVEFRESGWDVKRLFKLIVVSATYRQSAAASPEKRKADPENRLLSRGPRFRMDGEMIRDAALAASGLLARGIGGPSVKPPQPRGVWETVAVLFSDTRFYRPDAGADSRRRSLYTFWKRSAPPPSFEIFNAPTREGCIVRRERTNTPMQALVAMNDPQLLEAARRLAASALSLPGFDARLDYCTVRILARPFHGEERLGARSALRALLAHYGDSPEGAASTLLGSGEPRLAGSASSTELAAWTMLVSTLFNLDEALNK